MVTRAFLVGVLLLAAVTFAQDSTGTGSGTGITGFNSGYGSCSSDGSCSGPNSASDSGSDSDSSSGFDSGSGSSSDSGSGSGSGSGSSDQGFNEAGENVDDVQTMEISNSTTNSTSNGTVTSFPSAGSATGSIRSLAGITTIKAFLVAAFMFIL